MKKIFSALLVLLATATFAQTDDDTDSSIYYLIQTPQEKSDNPPMIVLLHGFGSNEEDLFSLKEVLPKNYYIVSVRAPFKMEEGSYMWSSLSVENKKVKSNPVEALASCDSLIKLIARIKEKYQLGNSPVYWMGFSQGAMMCYTLAIVKKMPMTGLIAMSGRMNDEAKAALTGFTPDASLRVFISHGKQDEVISIQLGMEANNLLKEKLKFVQFKEYEAGHEINEAMLKDLVEWLK
ncbi:MAG: hypothetical protein IPO27_00845 [Bacteroidetes bacterium]|nr:hypothetical protein [Bacteroidota bacterium]